MWKAPRQGTEEASAGLVDLVLQATVTMAQDRGREERSGQSDPANKGSNRGFCVTGERGLSSALARQQEGSETPGSTTPNGTQQLRTPRA